NVIGTNRELLAASLAARAAASNRSMKISASMAVPPWFAPAVLSAALRLRFKSSALANATARRGALNGLQHRRATEWLMASLRPVVRFAERDLWNITPV